MTTTWRQLVVMKSLPAEYRALRSLRPVVAKAVTPLIQLWDRKPTAGVEEGEQDPDEIESGEVGFFDQQPIWADGQSQPVWKRFRNGLFTKTRGSWDKEQAILLDGEWLEDSEAFRTIVANCRAAGIPVVPVTGLDRTMAYGQAIVDATASDRDGLVVRLRPTDFVGGTTALRERLDTLLAPVKLRPTGVDLVLDLGCLDEAFLERDELNAESMIRALPYLDDWRNLAIVGSGTPREVTESRFKRDEITPYRRLEWRLWQELLARRAFLGRLPIYGDYGVIHPDRVEPIGEPKSLPRIPKIIYASRDEMLMIRGHDLRPAGDDGQLGVLLDLLKRNDAWPGPDFSAGDAWFERAARGVDTPGDWGTWKWAGQVHLLTHTSQQLASLLGS